MNCHFKFKTIGTALIVSLLGGCACFTSEEAPELTKSIQPLVVKNVFYDTSYDANYNLDNYFNDQFIIFKRSFPDLIVSRESSRVIKITLPTYYGYQTGKSKLNVKLNTHIEKIAETLNTYKETAIEVTGHTDNVGNEKSNIKLSLARANEIKNELIKNNVDGPRIFVVGKGYSAPRCSNEIETGRNCNRRVEITIKDFAI